MKIFIAQQNYKIGDFEFNSSKIIETIQKAKKQKADIVVFSEMSICGYPAQDLLLSESFLQDCHLTIHRLKKYSKNIGVVVSAPEKTVVDGESKLFNAAYFLYNGEIQSIIRKLYISGSGANHDWRYFEKNDQEKGILTFQEKKIAIFVGQMWNTNHSPALPGRYVDKLKNADIAINISATVFDYTAGEYQKEFLKQLAFESKTPVVYCNAAGGQGGAILEGRSMVFDAGGFQCLSLNYFAEDEAALTISDDGVCSAPGPEPAGVLTGESFDIDTYSPGYHIEQIRDALVCGIRDYFNKSGVKKAIVGNSGGIDSAVTLALAVQALGKRNVFALLMPSQHSSEGSVSDGEQLCKNLGIDYKIIPIKAIFSRFLQSLNPLFGAKPLDLTEENLQARIRGNLLMAVANKFRYVLLNTSNKSELSVGYGTMYGDLCGGLSVLGDCYKMQVYSLAGSFNKSKELIPENILKKAPSAELHTGQLDSDSLPPYEKLDQILYQYIDRRKPVKEISAMGFEEKMITRTIEMINKNEFKRHQFCPIIGVSPVTFGVGRSMPVVASYSK